MKCRLSCDGLRVAGLVGLVVAGLAFSSAARALEAASETGPVSEGDGEFSNDTWDVRFLTNSRDMQTFSGTSVEDITSGGLPVCERRFEISGSKLTAVPT